MAITFIEAVSIEATSGQMRVTFESGGEQFRFHLQPHIALKFRETILRDSWQVLCEPDAEVMLLSTPVRKRSA